MKKATASTRSLTLSKTTLRNLKALTVRTGIKAGENKKGDTNACPILVPPSAGNVW